MPAATSLESRRQRLVGREHHLAGGRAGRGVETRRDRVVAGRRGEVGLEIELTTPACPLKDEIRARIEAAGYSVVEIGNSECAKLDGGMSCLSLRFTPSR